MIAKASDTTNSCFVQNAGTVPTDDGESIGYNRGIAKAPPRGVQKGRCMLSNVSIFRKKQMQQTLT